MTTIQQLAVDVFSEDLTYELLSDALTGVFATGEIVAHTSVTDYEMAQLNDIASALWVERFWGRTAPFTEPWRLEDA